MSAPEIPFEQAIAQLEKVVSRLESGELSLDESLRCFEEGIALQRGCIAQLDAAQRRIEVLQEAPEPAVKPVHRAAADRGENGLALAFEDAGPGV